MFFLVGPTAVGKSEIAVAVAERCNAEIIGADAFQIYAGLDRLTAKPSREQLARVPHHLVGTVPLQETFDVARYRAAALEAIRAVRARGKRVLIAGGTGLYVTALSRGLADLPEADPALRAELSALRLEELQNRYAALDPAGAARIDLQNPRRVIRALEVCLLTGRPFSTFQTAWKTAPPLHGAVLTRDRADLHRRIESRTEAMFAAGVIEEVRAAGEVSDTARQTIGFRDIRAHLAGEIGREETIARMEQATRRYAKRQLTWFRREPSLQPYHLSTSSPLEPTVSTIARQLTAAPPFADD